MITEKISRGFGDLTIDSTVILDETDRKAIQENIRTRGAVAVELPDTDDSKKAVHGMYYTMNDTESGTFDHDIAVIGWDDHFPKEYFNEPAEEDGAWITYNSGFSANKYYYVSYCTPFGYALSHRVTDQYGEVLSYDAGTEEDTIIRTGDSTKTANVFHKTGRLAAVGTYNHFDTQDIRIEIYDMKENMVLTLEASDKKHDVKTDPAHYEAISKQVSKSIPQIRRDFAGRFTNGQRYLECAGRKFDQPTHYARKIMLLGDLYDDLTLDRFIGYCIDADKMDIASFKGILREYNAGKLKLPEPVSENMGTTSEMDYRDDDPALTRDCSYYEANTMAEVHR